MGGAVVAVSAWDPTTQRAFTFRKAQGIDPAELSRLTDTLGTIDRSAAADRGYEALPATSWLEQEVDVRGVTCSYFEQVQGQSNHYWEQDEVLQKLDARMTAAFANVQQRAAAEQVSLRDGAYLIAIERVAHACRERGWV